MVKLNEALLVGISLLAALVFSKGRESTPSVSNVPFVSPYTTLLGEAQTEAIEKLESNISTLESVRQSNLGIAENILNYERSLADVNIAKVQTELDKTQSYIGALQKRAQVIPKYGITLDQANYINQYGISSAFKRWQDPKIAQVANIRQARSLIPTAVEFEQKQIAEIDRLEEEYQTRFGGLRRYG